MANLKKMGTEQLRTAISQGKFEGAELESAQELLAERDAKAAEKEAGDSKPKAKKTAPKKDTKKATKKAATKKPKKEKAEGEETVKTIEDYKGDGIVGLVRKMILGKEPRVEGEKKVAACTYGEANKAVEKKFGRKLYPSEFSRCFDVLKKLGLVDEKRPPRYKAEGTEAPKEK